jgi:hypothetical protein
MGVLRSTLNVGYSRAQIQYFPRGETAGISKFPLPPPPPPPATRPSLVVSVCLLNPPLPSGGGGGEWSVGA